MNKKKGRKRKEKFDLRLEIDRFFDRMRYKNDNKEYPGTEHSYQNTTDLVNTLLIKCKEDFVITKEPKRNFIFNNDVREEGFRIYFSFKDPHKFDYFKDELFKSFKEHLFIKIKRSNVQDIFMGQVVLTRLKEKNEQDNKEVKWNNMR